VPADLPVVTAVLAVYAVMSAVAMFLYWIDKRRARGQAWRIAETTLHVVELLGGWPGAWVGQRIFRHKWHKRSYMLVFWAIVAGHAAAWAWWWAA